MTRLILVLGLTLLTGACSFSYFTPDGYRVDCTVINNTINCVQTTERITYPCWDPTGGNCK